MFSNILKTISTPFKNLAEKAGNKLTQVVLGDWAKNPSKGTNVFANIADIKEQLNTLQGRDRSNLVHSLLDEFNISPKVTNFDTDNILKVLQRRLNEEEKVPEENFNEQLFEEQDPTAYVGENQSLEEIFKNNPNAQVLVQQGNGPEFYISKRTYDKWVKNQEEGIDGNYSDVNLGEELTVKEIVNPDLLDFTRIARKNEIGGIDDLRININEFENEDYYCPSNLKCIKKCIIRYLKIKGDQETIDKLNELETKKGKTYYKINIKDVTKSNSVNIILKEHKLKYRIAFSYDSLKKSKEPGIETIPLKEVKLRGIGVGYSHSVLLKRKFNQLYKSDVAFKEVMASKIELENIKDFENLKQFEPERFYATQDDETGEITQLPFFKSDEEEFQMNPLNIMTFDYEAYQTNYIDNKLKNGKFNENDRQRQYPYLATWAYRNEKGEIQKDHCWDLESPENVNEGLITAIKKRVKDLIQISKKKAEEIKKLMKEDDKPISYSSTLTMVSHNGAGYDNHMFIRFLKDKHLEIGNYTGDEAKIKTFEISFKDIRGSHKVRFVDSYLFTGKSLDESCVAFGVEGKNDFDISNFLNKKDILENKTNITNYGIQDSVCLLELVENINKCYKEATGIDLSPFRYISLPSYASKTCYHTSDMKDIWINKRREITDFEQGAVYGGRLVVGSLFFEIWESINKDPEGIELIEKHCIENMQDAARIPEEDLIKWRKICARNGMRNPDINSLYPTAMANYEYPCGKSKFIRNKEKCRKLCKLLNKEKYKYMCIAKCKIKVNTRCIIPMIPNKQKDGSISTKENEFVCTATSVEIQEAVKHGGYKVLEIYMYEEWTKKKYIFKNFIDKMYSKRLEYKKMKKEATNKNDEKKYNILQELCKLIMNASYGKIIQRPFDDVFKVTTVKEWCNEIADQNTELVQVINGGRNVLYRKKNKDVHENKLPKYLGAFVLSFSKKHMNDYIAAVDGFFKPVIRYMDTDSLYFDTKYFDLLKTKGLIGPELGQATPDYDVDIKEYVSLGKKIKFCLLTDNKLKTTFKGYSGLKKISAEDKITFFKELKEIAKDTKLSQDCKFMSKSTTRFNKKGLNITIQELKRDFKPTWSTHYKKIDNWLYPKYYTFD